MLTLNAFSIKISLSFWAILLVCYAVVSSVSGQKLVIICLFCSLIHELGHIIMICRYKGKPKSIVIKPFEIQIHTTRDVCTLKEDILITSFGVIFNLILSAVSYLIYLVYPSSTFMQICISSFGIAIMNMLPLETFDGGQLLNLLLCKLFGQRWARCVINALSIIAIFPLAFMGIAVLFISRYNFSVLFIALYLLSIYISKEMR